MSWWHSNQLSYASKTDGDFSFNNICKQVFDLEYYKTAIFLYLTKHTPPLLHDVWDSLKHHVKVGGVHSNIINIHTCAFHVCIIQKNN